MPPQMADIPFEVLERLRQDGSGPSGAAARALALAAKQKKFSRENKHRPAEMSSKKPVSRFREVIQASVLAGQPGSFARRHCCRSLL